MGQAQKSCLNIKSLVVKKCFCNIDNTYNKHRILDFHHALCTNGINENKIRILKWVVNNTTSPDRLVEILSSTEVMWEKANLF